MTTTSDLINLRMSNFYIKVLPDILHTVRSQSLTPNPQFEDGKTMQQPPENTIPRAVSGMQPTANPFPPADAGALQRGEQVFKSFCVPCHGVSGNGDGIVAQRGFPDTPSLVSERIINMTDDGIFSVITYGSAAMPAHAGQIDRSDRWKAILYVRKLQSGGK